MEKVLIVGLMLAVKMEPSGGNGTSALGIEHEETAVNVQSGGKIICGFGGGGGGSGARQKDPGADRSACGGGGGGGGAGLPAGAGGDRGRRRSGNEDEVTTGFDGGAGQLEENGEGGSGGNNADEAFGGSGGRGGDPFESAAMVAVVMVAEFKWWSRMQMVLLFVELTQTFKLMLQVVDKLQEVQLPQQV